jgi:hypothetical protein
VSKDNDEKIIKILTFVIVYTFLKPTVIGISTFFNGVLPALIMANKLSLGSTCLAAGGGAFFNWKPFIMARYLK